MAKKFVRGITDIKTINNQDFDTNNVNDLLSDGEHNYIHRKKGTAEEYHNLTNNLKTLVSEDTDLLEVTNDNDSNNSATIHPKHDAQKEQLLESERDTISIEHAENGTSETTKVDTNPSKVLEHENLLTDYGISKTSSGNTLKLGLEYTSVPNGFDLNTITSGFVRGVDLTNAPTTGVYFVDTFIGGTYTFQKAVKINDVRNTKYVRRKVGDVWYAWRQQAGDQELIDNLLAQKQNTLTNNTSIGVSGTGLQQLYTQKQTYSHTNGILKTHVKSVSQNTSVSTAEEEFNFIVKINKGATSASFTLNDHDKTKFTNIMSTYGQSNSVRISGLIFTLSGSSLTVTTANSVNHDYVVTFSDII